MCSFVRTRNDENRYALITHSRKASLLNSLHALNYAGGFDNIHITRYIFAIKHTHRHRRVFNTTRKIASFPTVCSRINNNINKNYEYATNTIHRGRNQRHQMAARALSWKSVHYVKLATGHCLPSPTTLQDKLVRFARCRRCVFDVVVAAAQPI